MFLGSHKGNQAVGRADQRQFDLGRLEHDDPALRERPRRRGSSGGVAGLTGTISTNWACPHPNFVAFLASDNICNGGGTGPAGTGSCGDPLAQV